MSHQPDLQELAQFQRDCGYTLGLAVLKAAEAGLNPNSDEKVAGALLDFRVAYAEFLAAAEQHDN